MRRLESIFYQKPTGKPKIQMVWPHSTSRSGWHVSSIRKAGVQGGQRAMKSEIARTPTVQAAISSLAGRGNTDGSVPWTIN